MSISERHIWYQTVDKVVVSAEIPKADERNCKVTIEKDRLLIEADGDIRQEFHLCQSIDAEKSFYKCDSVKVEVTLMKLAVLRWADLTKEKVETKPEKVNIYSKNWEALAKSLLGQEVNDSEDGDDDDAIKALRKAYKNAPPNSRRAMARSMQESNGTTLSLNWSETREGNMDDVD